MIGIPYFVAIGGEAHSTADTLIEIAAPSTGVVFIERIYISQSSKDASENLACKVERITTTGTGTATTPEPNFTSLAFPGTVKTNLTVEPTYSGDVLLEQGFNILPGFLWMAGTDEEAIVIPPSTIVGIMLDVAPGASMDFHYGCTLKYVGG